MISFPNKKYDVIVVDPPWPIKKIARKVRPNQIDMDYKVMSVEEITTLPIQSITHSARCWCFLWTTHAFLPKSFAILNAWGFRYQRTLTWDKQNGLCLFGFHHRTEFVLVGYAGRVKMYPKQKAISTVFAESSWRKHSVKPNIFYDLVTPLGENRIDVFARTQRDGWDVWGDEVL